MKRFLVVSLCVLSACASMDRPMRDSMGTQAFDSSDAQGIHLELIERMLGSRRAFAALAHLDTLQDAERTGERARLLRAEALRQIGEVDDARRHYTALLGGAFAGPAHRGLGLLAASVGQMADAIHHLQAARQVLPADARIRNDLGYAYVVTGSLSQAHRELRTAIELSPKDSIAISNMLLLFFVSGESEQVARWVERHALPPDRVAAVRREAERLVGVAISAAPARNPQPPSEVYAAMAVLEENAEEPKHVHGDRDCCADALEASRHEPFVRSWLELQRSGRCAGSAPRLPASAGVRIYRDYLSRFSDPVATRR